MKFGGIAILAAAAAIASMPGAVLAADLSQPMAAPMLAQTDAAYNWTGGYIGANIGYGWSNNVSGETHMYTDDDPLTEYSGSPLPGFSFSGSGLIGGAEAGYNWQNGNFVVGVTGDIAAANIRGSYTDSSTAFSVDSTINWLGTARLNVGVAMGRALVYGTGGLAVGGVTAGLHDYYDGGNVTIDSSASNTNVGWTIGGGVAAAVGNNWVVKAEYLYVDLGTKDLSFREEPDGPYGFPLITSSSKTTANVLKFSVDYKF